MGQHLHMRICAKACVFLSGTAGTQITYVVTLNRVPKVDMARVIGDVGVREWARCLPMALWKGVSNYLFVPPKVERGWGRIEAGEVWCIGSR